MGGWGAVPGILVLLESESQLFSRGNLNTGGGDLMPSGNLCFVGRSGDEALLCGPAFL